MGLLQALVRSILIICLLILLAVTIALLFGTTLNADIVLFGRSGCFHEIDVLFGRERAIPLCGFYPAVSPDGKHLAYIRGARVQALEVYLVELPYAPGDPIDQLTHDELGNYAPAWSPDGTQLAFWEFQPLTNRWDLLIVDVESVEISSTRALGTFEVGYPTLAWSPDSRWLAFGAGRFSTGVELYLMDVGSGVVRRLTENGFRDDSPAWSPDGTQLVFTSAEDGFNRLYILNLETDERHLLTTDHYGYMPAWSPDGAQIVYGSSIDNEWNDLFIINVDGTGIRQLTHRSDATGVDESEPEWIP